MRSQQLPTPDDGHGRSRSRPALYLLEPEVQTQRVVEQLAWDSEQELVSFPDAEQLLRALAKEQHAIVIMSDQVKTRGGKSCQEHLLGLALAVPVVVLSSNPDVRAAVRAMQLGACDYLLKPITAARLKQAIGCSNEHAERHFKRLQEERAEQLALQALSPRERDVLRRIAEGETSKRIASVLQISKKTVQTHRISIGRKLNLRTHAQVVRLAVRNAKLLPASDAPTLTFQPPSTHPDYMR